MPSQAVVRGSHLPRNAWKFVCKLAPLLLSIADCVVHGDWRCRSTLFRSALFGYPFLWLGRAVASAACSVWERETEYIAPRRHCDVLNSVDRISHGRGIQRLTGIEVPEWTAGYSFNRFQRAGVVAKE
jgi:hypothetical protein